MAMGRACEVISRRLYVGPGSRGVFTWCGEGTPAELHPAKRRRVDSSQDSLSTFLGQKEREAFCELLELPTIQRFLQRDTKMWMSDKYLLAMALIYFKRAGLTVDEYTIGNFYCALFLANQTEEDKLFYKRMYDDIAKVYPLRFFQKKKNAFWVRIQRCTYVAPEELEEVMRGDDHWAWRRERNVHLGGAIRHYMPRNTIPAGPPPVRAEGRPAASVRLAQVPQRRWSGGCRCV